MTYNGRVEAWFTVPASTTLSATTNAGGPTTVTVTAGTYTISTLISQLQANLIAQRTVTGGTWTVSLSTGASGTGRVTIATTAGSFAITWSSTVLRDLLGFTGNISTTFSSTGTNQARGLWIPDCPLALECPDPTQAPRITDRRSTRSPTGRVISLKGSSRYIHRNIRWPMVPRNRVWRSAEVIVNQSWQRFLEDVAWGEGLSWFDGSAYVVVYDLNGNIVGDAAAIAGWYMTGSGINNLTPRAPVDQWNGVWSIEGIDLESDG